LPRWLDIFERNQNMKKPLDNCDSETQAAALSSEPRSVRDRLSRVRAVASRRKPQSAPVSGFADKLEEKPDTIHYPFADA
jgi:hypothetical protein